MPVIAYGAIVIPCAKGTAAMCGFNDIFVLINSLIKFFLTTILLPLLVVIISYAGFLFMFSGGNEEQRGKAKKIFKNIVIGLLLILCSWFIIYTLFKAFGYDTARGRAGLSDSTINWQTSSGSGLLASVNIPPILGGTSKLAMAGLYKASFTTNTTVPSNTKVTVTISPKAPNAMSILVSCVSTDGDKRIENEGKIASGSTVGSVNLKLEEDQSYNCEVENTEGTLSGVFSVTTPVVTPGLIKPFSITSSQFNPTDIVINYDNPASLYNGYGNLYCYNSGTNNYIIPNFGILIDQSKKTNNVSFNIPANVIKSLQSDTNVDCFLDVWVKSIDPKVKTTMQTIPFSGVLQSDKSLNKFINTQFAITRVDQKQSTIELTFNGSIDVDPNMDLVCVSYAVNHKYQSKVFFDMGAINKKNGRANPGNTNGTIDSPIVLPVVWTGYGLRPNTTYDCNLSGKTVPDISGYPKQPIKLMDTSFNIYTPKIPLIQNPESKWQYPVIIGMPRVFYKTYNPPAGILKQIPIFKQYIPDSIVVPVVNGLVVDNQTMFVTCNQILGPAKTSWTKKVGLDNSDSDNSSKIIESVFAIDISKDPATGFMHSSVYSCIANFFVDDIPQIRVFMVSTPVYIDPTEIGPIDLRADNVTANKEFAFFTLVASPRIENSVNYTCSNSTGNYSGEITWVAQALGVQIPVAIPVSDILPGLRPNRIYNCELKGSTYQKVKVNYQFNIKTP